MEAVAAMHFGHHQYVHCIIGVLGYLWVVQADMKAKLTTTKSRKPILIPFIRNLPPEPMVPKEIKKALHQTTGRHWKRNVDGTKRKLPLNYWTRGRRKSQEVILKRQPK